MGARSAPTSSCSPLRPATNDLATDARVAAKVRRVDHLDRQLVIPTSDLPFWAGLAGCPPALPRRRYMPGPDAATTADDRRAALDPGARQGQIGSCSEVVA